MTKTISSEVVVAYSHCHYKAFCLMSAKIDGCQHEYIEVLKQTKQHIQYEYLQRLKKNHSNVQLYSLEALNIGYDFLIGASLEFNGLVADCPVLSRVESDSKTTENYYEPTIFIGTYEIRKEHKLELFFVAYVLEQIQGKRPALGRIIDQNNKVVPVQTNFYRNDWTKVLYVIE